MARNVTLRLRGLMLERFLQRALLEGIELSRVKRISPRETTFRATDRDAARLLNLAQTYNLDLTITGHSGTSKLLRAVRHRPSLPLALILCLLLSTVFLSRLWLIDLPPNATPAFLETLYTLGIHPGTPLTSIDTRTLEDELYTALGNYAFVGVRLDGVRLKISAIPELPEPDLYTVSNSRDLVAAHDAVLLAVNAFTGEATVKPGDTVRRGQLLIKGQEKISDEVTHSVCALGEAIGRTWITDEQQGSLTQFEMEKTGRWSLSSELRLFDYSFPLRDAPTFASEWTTIERLPVGGLYLPLMIVRIRHEETQESPKIINPDALRQQLTDVAMKNALNKVPENAEIVDKWVDYSMIEEDQIRVRAVVEVRQNIAISRAALTVGGN